VAKEIDHAEMQEFFDMASGGGKSIIRQVAEEWSTLQHMAPHTVEQGWRDERLIYTLRLPPSGHFVRLDTSNSIAVVTAALGRDLARLGVRRLTTAALAGEDRRVTTLIAEWVWSQTLADGAKPHGIEYGSKHGNNWRCWAIWLRRIDDGLAGELTTSDKGSQIMEPRQNPALEQVAELFNLKVF